MILDPDSKGLSARAEFASDLDAYPAETHLEEVPTQEISAGRTGR